METHLKIEHLAPYLPYDLLLWYPEKLPFSEWFDRKKEAHSLKMGVVSMMSCIKGNSKPILHPLSDLTKEIELNGERFVPWKVLRGIYDEFDINKDPEDLDDLLIISGQGHYDEITFDSINNAFQKLYSWHFDLHNLIKNGLAISYNDLHN